MIKNPGYPFEFNQDACNTCDGLCCNGESGNIWVTKQEIISISAFLSMDTDEFITACLYKKGYKYSIKELKTGSNYACVFFDKNRNGCDIYQVRPEQCRTFPFWPYFKKHPEGAFKECPGVVKSQSEEENEVEPDRSDKQ